MFALNHSGQAGQDPMIKHSLLLSVTMFTCAVSALAAPRSTAAPEAALKSTVDELLVHLNKDARRYRSDEGAFYAMVDQVVVPRFDMAGIAHFALGKYGRAASPEQKQQFEDVLALTLVHSYANLMLERFDTMKLTWNPARAEAAGDRAKVNSVLVGDGGRNYPVGFAVRLVDGDWKIYDLEIEGVSLALNYRAQLGAEIKRTSLDAVIARMNKTYKLSTKSAAL